jgi:hypothetical protein
VRRASHSLLIALAVGVFALASAPVAGAARPSVFVSPTGSDSNPCTRARPCRSFNRAYHDARSGQTVRVAAGIYPGQTIGTDRTKSSTRDVVFARARGAIVVVTGDVIVSGRHVRLRGMRFLQGWQTRGSARDVTFSAIRAGYMLITSGSGIRVIGGEVYPGRNFAGDYDPMISTASGSGTPPRNILISRVRFHGWTRPPGSGFHTECLQIGAAVNLTIRKSRFWGCATHDIFIRSWGSINGGYHPLRNIRIENNYFGKTLDGYYSIQFVDDMAPNSTSFLVRNNSALQAFHDAIRRGSIRFSGNAISNMSSWECGQSFRSRWHHNVYGSGARCGSTDRVGRLRFVNPRRLDLRIGLGSAAINHGDPNSYPRSDIQGQRRPKGRRPDAGADERA